MALPLRIFYGILAFMLTLAVFIIALDALYNLLSSVPSNEAVKVDYNAILTVLLTTVTVIFTVCAIVLAILGIFGFRNLKRDAGRYAETQALAEITKAFGPRGSGTKLIEKEMLNQDGHHRKFVEKAIRAEVISLLPLIANQINNEALGMAMDEPTDEGEVD